MQKLTDIIRQPGAAPRRWLSRLAQLFRRKPKPVLHAARCVECGADVMTSLPTTEVIHLGCLIKQDERKKADELAASKRREQIDIMKIAIREVEAEKLNKECSQPATR